MQTLKRASILLLALLILITAVGLNFTYASGSYKLNTSVPTYVNAANAKYGRSSVSTYSAGTYYIYREYDGMLNISRKSSSPGAWINPKDNTANESDKQRFDEGDTYYVTGSVNVRTGPGTSYATVGKLAKHDQVSGEKAGNWLKFNYNGQTAYSSLRYFSDQKPADQDTTSNSAADIYYVTGSVNVRTGPGTGYATVGKLAKHDQVSGEKVGNWLRFNYNGQTAYSSLTYISDQKPAGQQTTSNSAANTDTYYVTGSVNVRTGPGTSYAVIGKLAKYDQITGEKIGNWLKFNYNGQTAYSSLRYISDQKPAIESATSKPVIPNTSSTPVENEKSEAISTSSPALYSLSRFKWLGVIRWGGYKYTWYSQKVLPGKGLTIPGRHVNKDGFVSDKDGYIVLANNAPKGTIFPTPFGYLGKVYDRGTYGNHLDVYVD